MKNWIEVDGIRLYVDPYADGLYVWKHDDPLAKPYVLGDVGSYGALMAYRLAISYHPAHEET